MRSSPILFELGRAQSRRARPGGTLRVRPRGSPRRRAVPCSRTWALPWRARLRRWVAARLRTYVSPETAWTVDRYLAAGLVVFGKTNTPEWGNHCTTSRCCSAGRSIPGRPTSRLRIQRRTAAAVAAGVVPARSGGDASTGSIRVPASCCGLVGLKPRRGRTSFAPGAGQGMEGLVNGHALTRTVRDSAALLDVMTGSVQGRPRTLAPAADDPRSSLRSPGSPPLRGS